MEVKEEPAEIKYTVLSVWIHNRPITSMSGNRNRHLLHFDLDRYFTINNFKKRIKCAVHAHAGYNNYKWFLH